MKKCNAPGWDGIEAVHLMHAHPILIIQLCILFNVMMHYSVVSQAFNNRILIPILKKRGNAADINNYRAITLSPPSISKLFEMCTLELYSEVFVTSSLHFGFKKKLGTGHALFTLRCAVDYYVTNGSTVNVAILDISKAFDRVCHVTMFRRLLNKGMPLNIVRLLATWYNGSCVCVGWGSAVSAYFSLTCGVRQGGVLSPVLFSIYVDRIIEHLRMSGYGYVIGGEFFRCIMCADDLVLVSHSFCVLQMMIDICVDELNCIGLSFNVKKSRFYVLNLDICAYVNQLHCTTISLHMCIRQDILELTFVLHMVFYKRSL